MKTVFLIHAHKELGLLNRLVDRLAGEGTAVYVHLDLKSALDPRQIDPRAHLVEPRLPVYWGDFSQVRATLHSMAHVLEHERDFGHLVFLSGQCYPVWPLAAITDFLEAHPSTEFLYHRPLSDGVPPSAMSRVEYFHYHGPSRLRRLGYRVLRKLMKLLGLRRRMVHGLTPHGGSSWFMLTRECIAHVLERAQDREYLRFMRSVHCVDEIFFQTLLCHSPFAGRIVARHYRYIDWSDCEQGLSDNPNLLREADFEKIVASGMMFCRKVDATLGERLMARLDEHRREQPEPAALHASAAQN